MFRIFALVVIVAAHVGLIVALSRSRQAHRDIERDEQTMTVVFLPEILSAPQSDPAPEPTPRPHRPATRTATHGEAEPSTQAPSESAASEIETRSAPEIDWMEEAKLAASRQVDSLERSRNRAMGVTEMNLGAGPKQKPEFHWSHAQTHRIEPLPEGGTLIWINERCVLVLNGGLIPFCKLGKIEARGDLFEHMHDAPDPDDWKQPP